jgi:hypothetical protein
LFILLINQYLRASFLESISYGLFPDFPYRPDFCLPACFAVSDENHLPYFKNSKFEDNFAHRNVVESAGVTGILA